MQTTIFCSMPPRTINANKGEMTTVTINSQTGDGFKQALCVHILPLPTTAGNWKHRLFPNDVAA